MQMGLESITLKKLHSFFVAAEAACSKGDLPVAAVEARLAAVDGFATAAVPTVLAAAVPVLLKNAIGAAQALSNPNTQNNPTQSIGVWRQQKKLFSATRNVKYSSSPRTIWNGFKNAIRSFLVYRDFAFATISCEYFEFNWTVFTGSAVEFVQANNGINILFRLWILARLFEIQHGYDL